MRRFLLSPSFLVGLAMLLMNLLVYFPFRHKPDVLYRNYDGPFYMYVARTLYDMPKDAVFDDYLGLKSSYYPSHLPAYPVLIRVVSYVTGGNYPVAMLLATTLSAIAASVLFLRLLQAWGLVASPVWTALLFCFLPPRWLLYHSVGATEPLFLCFIFAAFLALKKNKDLLVVLFIILASLTRIMGILLVPAFILIYVQRKEFKKIPLICLSSAGLLGLFLFYHFQLGDFFAYFRHNLQEKGMIRPIPLEIFRLYASKVIFHSTELYILLYTIFGLGTLLLWKKREFFFYAMVFFGFACFIHHYDLSRHLIPVAPFSLLVAYDEILSKPAFKIFLVPLLLYMAFTYVWGWIPFPVITEESLKILLQELR